MAKSFFERLTGSVRVNDSPSPTVLEESQPLTREPRPIREKRAGVSSAPVSDPKTKVIHPLSSDESPLSSQPLPEEPSEEGQLTVDIYDDGPNIVIQSTVAGVKPDDIDISLQEETLTIRGSRKRAQEVLDDNFFYRELYWGTFSRSIVLPEEVDFQKAQAAIKNGLLTIRLPKKDRGEKKIQVKVGE